MLNMFRQARKIKLNWGGGKFDRYLDVFCLHCLFQWETWLSKNKVLSAVLTISWFPSGHSCLMRNSGCNSLQMKWNWIWWLISGEGHSGATGVSPSIGTGLWDTSRFSKHPPHHSVWSFCGFGFPSTHFFSVSFSVWMFGGNKWLPTLINQITQLHLVFLSRRSGNLFSLLLQFQSLDQCLEMFRWSISNPLWIHLCPIQEPEGAPWLFSRVWTMKISISSCISHHTCYISIIHIQTSPSWSLWWS